MQFVGYNFGLKGSTYTQENKVSFKGLTFILLKFDVMLFLLQVSLAIFDATVLNVTFMPFTANILTPNTVSLCLHNLRTAANLLVNQEDVYVPPCLCVQSCIHL